VKKGGGTDIKRKGGDEKGYSMFEKRAMCFFFKVYPFTLEAWGGPRKKRDVRKSPGRRSFS